MAEITRKSVLLECLSIMREELGICSKHYNGLEPKEGMEEAWEQAREKVRILRELIHAYDSEKVRKALAGWQQEVMENGPEGLSMADLDNMGTLMTAPTIYNEITPIDEALTLNEIRE